MKRIAMAFVCVVVAVSAYGQEFTLGGKYSNYETELSVGGEGFDTDRQSSLGFIVEYRNQGFVMKGQLDHDFESGLGFDFFNLADYSRDRIEVSAGYGVTKNIDLDFAVRIDSLSVDTFFFDDFFGGTDLDQEALGAGVMFHSDPAAEFGYFLMARGYVGSAELDLGVGADVDTTGFRIEGGIPISLGESGWKIVPGIEWERFETDDILTIEGFEFETNRLVLGFTYTM